MEILAKPSGITLQEHVKHVLEEGNYIQESFSISFQKYSNIIKKDLGKRVSGAIRFHDSGKNNPKWQNACRADYEVFLNWNKKNSGGFTDFSKDNKNIAGKNLRNSGVRHEIMSLNNHFKDGFSKPVKVAIAAHHSKLSRKHEHRWLDNSSGDFSSKIWSELNGLNGCFKNHFDFENAVLKHYEFAGVRAKLQLADHRASAKEDAKLVIDFKKFSYNFPEGWDKRNVQKMAEKYADEELLLFRAPTGAGKTDASLLWASKQIENRRAERLIIAMPTRFTSNALSINVTETLSNTGLYHSSAWFTKFHKHVKTGEISPEYAKQEQEYARQLLTPVTVCTIDHLLMSLTLSREEHHSIVFNLANSCVVIDEADFYDEFTQSNILVLLTALRKLKVPVMIMSASLPESCLKMYNSIGYNVIDIKEDTSDLIRKRCEVVEIRKYEKLNELDDLLQICLDKACAIIYANTVAKAIEFFKWFKNRGVTPILYHSRFTEPDKKEKEQELIKALGKDAWKNGTASGIAILTQIGEMSVNISADLMISDLCPIDRLVQRAGRLSRFDKGKIGRLHIVIPHKDTSLYPAPYGNYFPRKGWEQNDALEKTKSLLQTKKYSAGDFVELVNQVYPEFKELNARAENNAILLKQKFISNWLILPLNQSRDDDTNSQDWRSRDIVGNETVFVCFPNIDNFYNRQEFQEFKIENSIDVSSYLIKKGIVNNRVIRKDIFVSGEEITIFIAINCYDLEFGLQLTGDFKDDQFL